MIPLELRATTSAATLARLPGTRTSARLQARACTDGPVTILESGSELSDEDEDDNTGDSGRDGAHDHGRAAPAPPHPCAAPTIADDASAHDPLAPPTLIEADSTNADEGTSPAAAAELEKPDTYAWTDQLNFAGIVYGAVRAAQIRDCTAMRGVCTIDSATSAITAAIVATVDPVPTKMPLVTLHQRHGPPGAQHPIYAQTRQRIVLYVLQNMPVVADPAVVTARNTYRDVGTFTAIVRTFVADYVTQLPRPTDATRPVYAEFRVPESPHTTVIVRRIPHVLQWTRGQVAFRDLAGLPDLFPMSPAGKSATLVAGKKSKRVAAPAAVADGDEDGDEDVTITLVAKRARTSAARSNSRGAATTAVVRAGAAPTASTGTGKHRRAAAVAAAASIAAQSGLDFPLAAPTTKATVTPALDALAETVADEGAAKMVDALYEMVAQVVRATGAVDGAVAAIDASVARGCEARMQPAQIMVMTRSVLKLQRWW